MAGQRPVVLLVETDRELRALAADRLDAEGYEVVEGVGLRDVRARLARAGVAAVVASADVASRSVRELLREIKGLSPLVPLVPLLGHTDGDYELLLARLRWRLYDGP